MAFVDGFKLPTNLLNSPFIWEWKLPNGWANRLVAQLISPIIHPSGRQKGQISKYNLLILLS
jgi:hypothetical protein